MSEDPETPQPGPERGRHDKLGRQRALMDWARVVFADRGYDAATTREIAEKAGCSEGLIHRYFGGKPGLLSAVLQQRAMMRQGDLSAQLPRQKTVEAELVCFFDWEIEASWDDRATMRVTVSRSVIDPIIGTAAREFFHATRVDFLEERLAWHKSEGRIRKNLDMAIVASTISGFAFHAGFFAQVAFQEPQERVKSEARTIAAVLARGLAP